MKNSIDKIAEYREAISQDLRRIESALGDSSFENEISDFAVKNPIKSISIALLAGFIIGSWWKKK